MSKRELPFCRSPYNYDVIAVGEVHCVKEWPPSLTQQSQSEEADINTIVRRFGLTGQLPAMDKLPVWDDFSDAPDFQTAQNMLVEARESFMRLPPEIRLRFNNEAARFVDFASDPGNIDDMVKMGLAVKKENWNGEGNGSGKQGVVSPQASAEHADGGSRAPGEPKGSQSG